MLAFVALLAAAGWLAAASGTALLVRLGHRIGALDSPGAAGHAKALRKVPNIGGIAIAAATLVPLVAGLAAASLDPAVVSRIVPALAPHAERIASESGVWWAILAGGALMHVIGLVDDRRSLAAWPKFIIQALIAGAVAGAFGMQMVPMPESWGSGGVALGIAVTTLWIVVVVNAINFLDNMDGLAGGVALVGAIVLCTAAFLVSQWFVAGALALLAGALAGFLLFNAPWRAGSSARIFMGDGGSLFTGWMLALLSVRLTCADPDDPTYALGGAWYGWLLPALALAVPLYDLLVVSAIRIAQGRPPWLGDQQHFSHRLVDRGFTPRGAVMLIWLVSAIVGAGGLLIGSLRPWQAVLVGLQAVAALGVLALLEARPARGAALDVRRPGDASLGRGQDRA
jgi:UDP-GlcNAc:undecaprenyl-phosphate GlcNAc-1-phosphate transferase